MPQGTPAKETLAAIQKLAGFAALRDAVKAHQTKHKGHAGQAHRYPPEVRIKAVALASRALAKGIGVTPTLEAAGLASSALYWPEVRAITPKRKRRVAMRPVEVGRRASANGALVVTTPEGYQIEGPAALVAELLKTLRG